MLGSGEILVIFVVLLILFGGKRLPEFAQSLGKGIREFKKACNGEEDRSSNPVMQPEKIKTGHPPTLPLDSSNDQT
jgi:sec-independent protein translocase protein TatA